MSGLEFGISLEAVHLVSRKIHELKSQNIEIALVIGGGNFFRGIQQGPGLGIDRTPADQIGMLATLINGIALQEALIKEGCSCHVLSALDCPSVAEKYEWHKAMRYLAQGSVVLFVGGTGHPYFTTDTAAALRACEIHADILLKATTRVDGVYDKDPRTHKDAKKYERISYKEVIEKQLGILDLSAVTMCMSQKIPIRVFNFYQGSFPDAISDKVFGTLVS